MKKIPTIFDRDWNGDRSRVVDKINPDAQWVLDGEGVATMKIDGTCCMVRGGKLFKRREARHEEMEDNTIPGFELAEIDYVTGKVVGWVPVGDGPEDCWHREAMANQLYDLPDGTYELIGPKVQGNPENAGRHLLISHADPELKLALVVDRTFDGIRTFLEGKNMEGIVFHHPDGRMAKIKGRDFGFKR